MKRAKQNKVAPAPTVDFEVFNIMDDAPANVLDYLQCADNGIYFEPLVSYESLMQLTTTGVHHASALQAKANILKKTFEPSEYLSRKDFELFVMNYLTLGDGYLQITRNRLGGVLKLTSLLTMYTRMASDMKHYLYIRNRFGLNGLQYDTIKIADVVNVKQHDLRQQIYGLPEYLPAMHSIMLNNSATRFRRRYYDNGSHAGFILYCTDEKINEDDWNVLKSNMRQSRGRGNFKNVMLRSPGGSPNGKDGIKLIPISEVAAKDEFLNIKSVSAEDMLAAHRVPAILMGIVPQNAGGLGDPIKAAKVFYEHEIAPIQESFKSINEQLGIDVFKFKDYQLDTPT